MDNYTRQAYLVRVIDGDTVVLDVDLGFYVRVQMSCRLAGINARELHDPGGEEAKRHLQSLLPPPNQLVMITSVYADKFAGRFDAIVYNLLGDVNSQMVSDGYAADWDGIGPKPIPSWPLEVVA